MEACDADPQQPASWTALVNRSSTKVGGQTIGTHHIDAVTATARFVRVRLLSVLEAPKPPQITFKVLDVRAPAGQAA